MKRKIEASLFAKAIGPLAPIDCGAAPSLRWIEIDRLVVDPIYQREIGRTGIKNIGRIAAEFDWSRFSTVIVAPDGEDCFVIVDGQHRTTAAALRGHKKVPCQIISVDQRKQAAAFAAINSNVTEMSSMQVHAAKVAAGDVDALRLNRICEVGGVKICRYPVPANKMRRGDTLAVTQLRKALERYGEKPLRLALQAITTTRDGNVGMVRGNLVEALCAALEPCPAWMNSPQLMAAFGRLDFKTMWIEAAKESISSRGKMVTLLSTAVRAHLSKHLGVKEVA